jgi:uncharacterized protein (DUF488 family)
MAESIFTIGHSNHPLERFVGLLCEHGVEAIADVRRFPGSRRFPHFSRSCLAAELPRYGVQYHWFESLGGRRGSPPGQRSPHTGLHSEGFRNFADYMLTDEFQAAILQLRDLAAQHRTAILCAEALFWRCHRMLISDYLEVHGVVVEHILPSGKLQRHQLTEGVVVEAGKLLYRGSGGLFS